MTFQSLTGVPAGARLCAQNAARPRKGGAYQWLTPYVASIAAHNDDVARRALALDRAELHFIALVAALTDCPLADDPRIVALARGLGALRRADLLTAAAPDADPRLLRFVGKLGGRVWRPAAYRRLATLMREPIAAKTLAHLPTITRRHVIILSRLPAAYRTSGVLRMANLGERLSHVAFAIEIVRRVRPDLNDRQIMKSLEKTDAHSMRSWVEAHYVRLPFPSAPTGPLMCGSGGVLRPVVSGADLEATALRYKNCAMGYLNDVWAGHLTFYRFERDATPLALVQLRKTPGCGWTVEHMEAPDNVTLDGATRGEIIARFAEEGFIASPQAISPRARYFHWY